MIKGSRSRRRVKRRGAQKVRRAASSAMHAQRSEAKAQMSGDGAVLIGGAHDPAEKAADRMAAQALSGNAVGPVPATPSPKIHRKCAGCEEGEKGSNKVARAAATGPSLAPGTKAAPATADASKAIASMGSGRPMAPGERAFFEPRFGRNFSSVRIHDGHAADRAANGIGARAFTRGNDVAFARNEREKGGKTLMAHELAHVSQSDQITTRRATLAAADHPSVADYKKVPKEQEPEVQAALKIIKNAMTAKKCQDYFKDNCTGGRADSAMKTFNAATVYFKPDSGEAFGLSDVRAVAADPHVVAYNKYAYRIGRWEIAATLLHELFHTCDMVVDNMDEIVAETATEVCGFYSPWILELIPGSLDVGDQLTVAGFSLGPNQDKDHFIKVGDVKITSYSKWKIEPDNSAVEVEFTIPKEVNENFWFAKTVDVVAVNHGIESNKRPLDVDP